MKCFETIIIGGGISGLACGKALSAGGASFLLIAKRVGGRISAPGNLMWNLGASYITSDYHHTSCFIRRNKRFRRRDTYFWDRDRFLTVFQPRNLKRLPSIGRLYRRLACFRRHLNLLRRRCIDLTQVEALQLDPLLAEYVKLPARQFILENCLSKVNTIFANPIVNSTVFVPADEINTFNYLDALLSILLPTYAVDIRGTVAALTDGWSDRIRQAEVFSVDRLDRDLFRVSTADADFQARRVVIATPPSAASVLCSDWPADDVAGVRETTKCALLVRGVRKLAYVPGKTVFLRPGHTTTVLFPNEAASGDVLFTDTLDPDLAEYYVNYRIVSAVRWQPAIVLAGSAWRSLEPLPGVYAIGDRNICGLEDSYLTGVCAARRILLEKPSPKARDITSRIDHVTSQVGVES